MIFQHHQVTPTILSTAGLVSHSASTNPAMKLPAWLVESCWWETLPDLGLLSTTRETLQKEKDFTSAPSSISLTILLWYS